MTSSGGTETYTGEDIYCDLILSGEMPVKVVRETDSVLVFYHTRPHWTVHLVVIPKRHIASLLDLDPHGSLAADLLAAVQLAGRLVLAETGSVAIQTHLGSYQDSKHLHWHVRSGEQVRPGT